MAENKELLDGVCGPPAELLITPVEDLPDDPDRPKDARFRYSLRIGVYTIAQYACDNVPGNISAFLYRAAFGLAKKFGVA